MSDSQNVLVATFVGLDWCAPHDVQTWWGQQWPDDIRVAAASYLLFDGDGRLVVANIRSRGWDVPGGRRDSGEGVLDGLARELAEEVGADAGDYTEPELLGWLLIEAPSPELLLYYRATLSTKRVLATEVPDEVSAVARFLLLACPRGSL